MTTTSRSGDADPTVVEDLGNECFICSESLERLETVLRIDGHLVHEYCLDDFSEEPKPDSEGTGNEQVQAG